MTTLLIDGNSIMNRAYYGIRPLTTKDGLNTNAVYGFLTILNKNMRRYQPDRVIAAFDRKEPTYRHTMYESYKAGRHAMPDELREQFPVIKEVLTAMGISCMEKAGLEADDILGTLSRVMVADETDRCIILTGDRDSFQLISPTVAVCLASKEDVHTDEAVLFEKYGLKPEQMTDLKALMGDSSDNIPGVPGVGEKTALTLLSTYGTLDNLFAHTDELKGALQTKIVNGKDSAYMSKQLGTIVTDADLSDLLAVQPQRDDNALQSLFNRLEMTSMTEKFGFEPVKEQDAEYTGTESYETDTLPDGDVLYLLYNGTCFTVADGDKAAVLSADKDTFTKVCARKIVTHDAKPLIRKAFEFGLQADVLYDTMLAGYLCDASRSSYSFANVYAMVSDKAAPQTDADCAVLLKELFEKTQNTLKEREQLDLYNKIELPLCTVLAEMEYTGFPADKSFLEQFGESIANDITDTRDAIWQTAGHEFNINSTKQLGTVLFEKLHLPVIRKTKTGYSTDNDVLEELLAKTDDPIIENIIEYRKLVKLRSTYVDGMINHVGEDGRIHTVFTQTVTQTGRISSTEPNLQNIPVRTKLGRELRKAFVAPEGNVLIDADYSQIELRVLADIANDTEMRVAFCEEKDIHTITASQVFGMPEEMITSELRRRAKAVNFGIVYGIGEYSLSKDINVSVREAKRYIQSYLDLYSGVKQYMEDIVAFGRENGYIKTKFGRRRYVPDINAKQHALRTFTERVCMNTPIQGTAADIIKLAMVGVSRRLKELDNGAHLIMQVHDELIIEAPEVCRDEVAKLLKEEMENAVKLSVPLTVDVGSGKTWYDAKD